jgi:predicted nucleic acid-binding protein
VLAHVEGVNGEARQQSAIALLRALARGATLVPVQALGELLNVLVRKSDWARDRARTAILTWRDAFPLAPTTEASIISAGDLSADHGLGIWDSITVAVAAEGGCRLLLSED